MFSSTAKHKHIRAHQSRDARMCDDDGCVFVYTRISGHVCAPLLLNNNRDAHPLLLLVLER